MIFGDRDSRTVFIISLSAYDIFHYFLCNDIIEVLLPEISIHFMLLHVISGDIK